MGGAQDRRCRNGLELSDLQVRACAPDELDRLRQGWPVPGDVAGSHFAEQQRGTATFLIAWRGDLPLGWAVVLWNGCRGPNARAAWPGVAEVVHLQVRPECRGQGVGTALLAAAERAVAGRGIQHAVLSVSLDNHDAARLYARLGYRNTGITDACCYDWVDSAGAVRTEHETSELLVKRV